jgi:hypothetical protein
VNFGSCRETRSSDLAIIMTGEKNLTRNTWLLKFDITLITKGFLTSTKTLKK